MGDTKRLAEQETWEEEKVKESRQLWGRPSQRFITQDRNNAALDKLT